MVRDIKPTALYTKFKPMMDGWIKKNNWSTRIVIQSPGHHGGSIIGLVDSHIKERATDEDFLEVIQSL